MFNQYGWALIDWWQAGGTYHTMRELVETSGSKEELTEKINRISPFDYHTSRRMAEAVFDTIKEQIRHDAEVRAELRNKPIIGTRFGLFPVRKAVAWWVVEDHSVHVFLECHHVQEYPIKRIELVSKLEEQGCLLCYLEDREGLPKGTLKRCSEAEAISIHSPLTMGAAVEDLRVAVLGIVEPVIIKLLDWATKHMPEIEAYNKSKESKAEGPDKRNFPCPVCKTDHLVEYTIGEGKSEKENDHFGEFGFDDTYYRWICPVTKKVAVSRMYWGEAFPM